MTVKLTTVKTNSKQIWDICLVHKFPIILRLNFFYLRKDDLTFYTSVSIAA